MRNETEIRNETRPRKLKTRFINVYNYRKKKKKELRNETRPRSSLAGRGVAQGFCSENWWREEKRVAHYLFSYGQVFSNRLASFPIFSRKHVDPFAQISHMQNEAANKHIEKRLDNQPSTTLT